MTFFNIKSRIGVPKEAVDDLVLANKLVTKMIKRQPWTDQAFGEGNTIEYSIDRKTGVYQQTILKKTSANRMV